MISYTRFLERTLAVRLTRPQWVWARVAVDGADPADLERASDRQLAMRLFGFDGRVPAEARHVAVLLKGARVGGTWMCSLALLWLGLTADLSGLAAGERAFAPIVAPDVRLARQALRYVQGAAEASPELAQLVVESSRDHLVLRRPDGHHVVFAALPPARGGSATRGRTLVGALMDESAFFRDESAAINDSEVYRSLVVRVLPGGRLFVISTAWSESGLLWDLVQNNHGAPTSAVAAIAPTLTMRPADERLRQIVQDEERRDFLNARREFYCEPFAQGTDRLIAPAALAEVVAHGRPLSLEPRPELPHGAAWDMAFRSDASACAVVRIEGGRFRLVQIDEVRPSRGQPLKPSEVVARFAAVVRRHDCDVVWVDQHHLESVREHALRHGLRVMTAPQGQSGKMAIWTSLRDAVHEGRLEVGPRHGELVRQLGEVVARPTPGGTVTISQPRRRGSHGDQAASLALAVYAADRGKCRGFDLETHRRARVALRRRFGRPRWRDIDPRYGAADEGRLTYFAPDED